MKSPEVIHTNGRDTGTIACRQCGKSKTIDLSRFHNVRKEVKVKCPCGTIFAVFFECRRDPRKCVKLAAQLFQYQTGQPIADVTITSLSLSGVGFTPSLTQHIQPGDRCRISFVLNDASQAQIEKDIIIRNVNAENTGAEFVEQDYHYDLDFYLMPLLES
jgi:hypothetical protein